MTWIPISAYPDDGAQRILQLTGDTGAVHAVLGYQVNHAWFMRDVTTGKGVAIKGWRVTGWQPFNIAAYAPRSFTELETRAQDNIRSGTLGTPWASDVAAWLVQEQAPLVGELCRLRALLDVAKKEGFVE